MSQHKQYILFVAVIFSGQVFLASLFMLSSDGSELQKKRITLLESQTQVLNTQLAELNKIKGRDIASIPENYAKQHKAQISDLEFELSGFYFSQIENFKKQKNKAAALEAIQKLQDSSTNKEYIAQSEYEKINLICNQNLELSCMKEIDAMLTQFPDSNWTAKSLLLLSHFYYKQNRITEAKSLIQVIQKEFKSYDMAYDIQKMSRQNL